MLAKAYVWASSGRAFTAAGIGPIPSSVFDDWCDRNDVTAPEYREFVHEVLRLVDAETLRRARAEASKRATPERQPGGNIPEKKPRRRRR